MELKLETVTPLFLAGADPRGAPELRAASVRELLLVLLFWSLATGRSRQHNDADVLVIFDKAVN